MEASKKPQYIRDFIVYVQKMVLTTQQFTRHVLVLIWITYEVGHILINS